MRERLRQWVLDAVDENGDEATIVDVAKYIWERHESELREAGNLFYTWQYEIRWVAQKLRHEGVLALGSKRKWVRVK